MRSSIIGARARKEAIIAPFSARVNTKIYIACNRIACYKIGKKEIATHA
jgi:hypothetical protein